MDTRAATLQAQDLFDPFPDIIIEHISVERRLTLDGLIYLIYKGKYNLGIPISANIQQITLWILLKIMFLKPEVRRVSECITKALFTIKLHLFPLCDRRRN